jgi:probable HAF family extracellular repeat protein
MASLEPGPGFAMSRQLLAASALLLCIACDQGVPVAPPPLLPSPPPAHANHAPVVHISGPTYSFEGAWVSFEASAFDQDNDLVTYTWLSGDGQSWIDSSTSSLHGSGWQYRDNGTVQVSVIATDRLGAADTASMSVIINNTAPMVRAWAPVQQAVGIPATLQFTISDSGAADTHSILVDWGDRSYDTAAVTDTSYWRADSITHVYSAAGIYTIHASVRDDDGGSTSPLFAPVIVFDGSERQTVAGYEVRDVGTLGGNSARPADFNDLGQIVGSSLTPSGDTHAFLWDAAGLRDIGTSGHEGSEAVQINDAGVIAGTVWRRLPSSADFDRKQIAAIWRDGSSLLLDSTRTSPPGMTFVPAAMNGTDDIIGWSCGHESCYGWLWRNGAWRMLKKSTYYDGPAETYPVAMNDRGQIVGHFPTHAWGESRIFHAFLWENDSIRDLGVLAPYHCDTFTDCSWAEAMDINESGQVVGTSTDSLGQDHFVLWEDGKIRNLAIAEWVYSLPGPRVLINNRGQIAMSSAGSAYFWSDGSLQRIGTFGGIVEIAGINEDGQVVGTVFSANGEQHVFVWSQARGVVDLGTGPHGFSAAWAVGINTRGDILGYAAPCELDSYRRCAYPKQVRALLWRRQ